MLTLGFFCGMKIKHYLGLVAISVFILGLCSNFYSHRGRVISYSHGETDFRVLKLQNLLQKYNSPLSAYAKLFISQADVFNLDWKLIPAITGVESSFGVYIPNDSYNAYGWDNGMGKFSNWPDSISHVTKKMSQDYVARGARTVEQIAPIYNPVTPNDWKEHVQYFMNQIEQSPPYINEVLNLSIDI